VKCNDVSILQSPLCTPNYAPYTIVTFNLAGTPPDGWVYDAAGCSALPGEQTPTSDKYQCDFGASGPLTAEGSCVDTLACVSLCPPHYNKIGDTCVWDGSGTDGTECLPGATYDPLTQCCTADSGTGVNFNLCPVGMYPLNGACVPNPSAVEEKISQGILFETCTPPGKNPGDDDDDTPNTCTFNDNYCGGLGMQFSSANCCCGRPTQTAPGGFVCLVYP
jgi:hypothetical protein